MVVSLRGWCGEGQVCNHEVLTCVINTAVVWWGRYAILQAVGADSDMSAKQDNRTDGCYFVKKSCYSFEL